MATKLKIEFEHHDAAEDARAAGEILIRAISESGVQIEDWLTRSHLPIGGSSSREGNATGVLFGARLVFTGALQIPRREASDMAAHIGCAVAANVTLKTSILVVGDQDIRKLRHGESRSKKQRQVEDLIAAGVSIRVIGESDFIALCQTEADLA